MKPAAAPAVQDMIAALAARQTDKGVPHSRDIQWSTHT